MKTVGNDLVRNQLHADRKWYLNIRLCAHYFRFGVI